MPVTEIAFTKMHGAANDYVYIDCRHGLLERLPELSIEMSNRHTGVGGDGIILILDSDKADCRMRIFNADGSEAMMCGNGIRCVAKYVWDNGIVTRNPMTVESNSGVKTITVVTGLDGKVTQATVDMGVPSTRPSDLPVIADAPLIDAEVTTSCGSLKLTAVSMGNPHGVVFVDDLSTVDVHALGRELENHPMWPDRANIEFAQMSPDGREATMRVWERGSGETMACGTGACATAVAAMLTGRASGCEVTIHLLGGDLRIKKSPEDGHVMMTGPAATVFSGKYIRQS